jgi:heme oxygenase
MTTLKFIDEIRKLTKPFHDSIERHNINRRLFIGNSNLDDYYKFLTIQYIVFRDIENRLADFTEDFNQNQIIIKHDSKKAKIELDNANIQIPDINFDTDFIDDFVSALAGYYIIEGSRNGAIVIAKELKRNITFDYDFIFLDVNPVTFFVDWQKVCQTINDGIIEYEDKEKFILTVCKLYLTMENFYDNF